MEFQGNASPIRLPYLGVAKIYEIINAVNQPAGISYRVYEEGGSNATSLLYLNGKEELTITPSTKDEVYRIVIAGTGMSWLLYYFVWDSTIFPSINISSDFQSYLFNRIKTASGFSLKKTPILGSKVINFLDHLVAFDKNVINFIRHCFFDIRYFVNFFLLFKLRLFKYRQRNRVVIYNSFKYMFFHISV